MVYQKNLSNGRDSNVFLSFEAAILLVVWVRNVIETSKKKKKKKKKFVFQGILSKTRSYKTRFIAIGSFKFKDVLSGNLPLKGYKL